MPIETPSSQRSALIAHALSHPVRIEILNLLNDKSLTVSEITVQLARPQANISQHLARLREVNLVDFRRNGMSVEYSLSLSAIPQLLALLEELAERIPANQLVPRGRGRGRGAGRGRGRQR